MSRTLGFETLNGNFFIGQAVRMAERNVIAPRIMYGFFSPEGELLRLSNKKEKKHLRGFKSYEHKPEFKVTRLEKSWFDRWNQPALHLWDSSGQEDEVYVSFRELHEAPEGTRYCAKAFNGYEEDEDIFLVGYKDTNGVHGLRNGEPVFIAYPTRICDKHGEES